MKKQTLTRILLALVLILALTCTMALTACKKEPAPEVETEGEGERTGAWRDATYTKDTELGEGEKTVTVKVVAEEQEIVFTIHTNEQYLDKAMLAHELVTGEDGQYGLYLETVNGMLADYNIDQTYWSVCKDNTPLPVGISSVEISDGDSFQLIKTK